MKNTWTVGGRSFSSRLILGTGKFSAPEMMRAKLKLLDHELDQFLPSIARRCGLDAHNPP